MDVVKKSVIKFSVDYEIDFDKFSILHAVKGEATEPVHTFVCMMNTLKKVNEMLDASKEKGAKTKDLVPLIKTKNELEKIVSFYGGMIQSTIQHS